MKCTQNIKESLQIEKHRDKINIVIHFLGIYEPEEKWHTAAQWNNFEGVI